MTSQDDSWQMVLLKNKYNGPIFSDIERYINYFYNNLRNAFGEKKPSCNDRTKYPNAGRFCQKIKYNGCLEDKKIIVNNNIFFLGGFRCLEFFAHNAKKVSAYYYPANIEPNDNYISSLYNIKMRLNENGEVVKNAEGQTMYYVEASDYFPDSSLFYNNVFKRLAFVIESDTLGDVYLNYVRGPKREADENDKYNSYREILHLNDTQYNFQMKDCDINIRSFGYYFNQMRLKFELEDKNAVVDFDSFEVLCKSNDELISQTIVHRHELVFVNKNEFIYKDFLFYLFTNEHMVIRFNKPIDAKVTLTLKNYDSFRMDKRYNSYFYYNSNERKCEVFSNVMTM